MPDNFSDLIARLRVTHADPDTHLSHIAEVSRNARTTWFGLLGILAFVGITLLAHKDADFFTRAAATKLPLVGITVPVEAFFYTAPVLVAAIYAYLHIYLIALWDALAEAPPRVGEAALADRTFPWLLNYMALRHRARARKDRCVEPRAMGWLTEHVSLHLGWIFGIFILGALWYRSMPVHDWLMTMVSGVCLVACLFIGARSYFYMRRRMEKLDRSEAVLPSHPLAVVGTCFGALVLYLTLAGTGTIPTSGDKLHPLMVRANLEEAELTPRPADWKPFELWLRDLRRDRKKDGVETDPEQAPLIPTQEEIQRWRLRVAALDAPQLKGKDLRGADLRAAFLPGADLREAEMQGADLSLAQMQGAGLGGAQIQGADLRGAEMQGADLRAAQMQGAGLGGAQIQGAELILAKMQGANLRWAEMQGANLFGAKMEGADLFVANMQGANCINAAFLAALVQFADLTCRNLDSAMLHLRFTVGNGRTLVPEGLQVRSCLIEEDLHEDIARRIDNALQHRPEEVSETDPIFGRRSRDGYRKALFCGPDEQPELVGRHPEPTPEGAEAQD